MKYSVCIDALFNGQDITESMETVKGCGIDTIEFWGWDNKDMDLLESKLKELSMKVSTFCSKATSLVDASQHESYLKNLEESIAIAKRLGVTRLIGLVGDDTGEAKALQQKNLIDGLKKCVPLLEEAGIVLMIEPLNILINHQGYYLSRSDEAFDIVRAVESPYVKVLFDIYHQQITEGNLLNNITANIDLIGHFHTAGHPGRNELYLGEINYPIILEAIDKMSYDGYIGLEYFPTADVEDGLSRILQIVGIE